MNSGGVEPQCKRLSSSSQDFLWLYEKPSYCSCKSSEIGSRKAWRWFEDSSRSLRVISNAVGIRLETPNAKTCKKTGNVEELEKQMFVKHLAFEFCLQRVTMSQTPESAVWELHTERNLPEQVGGSRMLRLGGDDGQHGLCGWLTSSACV